MGEEPTRIPLDDDVDVGGLWLRPPDASHLLVLAPGAGAPMRSPFLEGFAAAISERGIATLRFDFPYQDRGRRLPDREPVLRATWLAAFATGERWARERGIRIAAGGKSLGARIASLCVADGMAADALVFLGYPLHPPGRRDRIRDAHLERISVPMLWLQGTRDPFADEDLLETVLSRLAGRAALVAVDDADHSFHVRGTRRDPRAEGAALAPIAAAFLSRTLGGR